ncbi:MAG: hypothetical protein JWL77_6345 [Chthonomonadaceae bacterium]|nr:hypothetical protein [Chthonomonadaceae bacterium]
MSVEKETNGATQSTTTAVTPVMNSPFCRELRSKKYYFLQEMPTEIHHIRDASNHCWCRRTVQAFGPDGELVRPEDCNASRGCYRSLFEEGAS